MRKLTYAVLIVFLGLPLNPNPLFADTGSRSTSADARASNNAAENTATRGMPLAVGSNQPTSRMARQLVVSILWFENRAGSEAEHWRHGIQGALGVIRRVKAVRLRGGIGYAQRKLGIEEGSALSADQARRVGELVEAQRVVWGSYQRRDDGWEVSAFLLNVATGDLSGPLIAASTDWFDIEDDLTEQLLAQLRINPSDEEKKELFRRHTTSAGAYEWYIKAYALMVEGSPLSEQEVCVRQAIAADPLYAYAYAARAALLGSQGESKQAEEAARRALEIRPDDACAHRVLGFVLTQQQKYVQAQKALQEALRLEPDDAETLFSLGNLYSAQGKWDKVIVYDEKAIMLEPMNASIHAHLGLAYAYKRDRDKATLVLKEAERLVDPEGMRGVNAEQMICQAYGLLGEIPLAVEHYEKFVTLARTQGLNPKMVSWFEETAQHLKATLTPTFVEASMPKEYTTQMLQAALQERLPKAELDMVVNPVASSPEIRHWAQELTQGASSELDKAKAIFDRLTRRIQPGGQSGARTAQEVFALWSDPNESFNCQEYAKLYLAMAREVGVKVFYVHLGRDYRGKLVFHDCAVVFTEGKALLVDPAYHWFGVPHQAFVVLDDVQTIAHHFFQPGLSDERLSRCRLAARLHPDFAWGQLHLASALRSADRREEAYEALEAAARLEPGRWDTCRLRARMAADSEDWELAITHLHKALELNPEDAESHFLMGNALVAQTRQKEAREAYRACLRNGPRDIVADMARRAIVQINEAIGSEPGQEYETAALMVASEGGHTETVRRLLAEGVDVDAQEASGSTALMMAALNGHTDVVELLLEKNADVNMREQADGATALMAAIEKGHVDVVRLLLEHNADLNVQSKKEGVTALMMAAQRGHADMVKRLLENGPKVNTQNTNGVTALMAASEMGHADTVRLLIQRGADVTVEATGHTALSLARSKGHTEIIELLTRALQAQLDAWGNEGRPVSPAELRAYYEEVKAGRFITGPKVQFRLIDIDPASLELSQINSAVNETSKEAALRIAIELSERAAQGEEFGELAKTYSHGILRSRGGLWRPVSPDSLASPYDVLGRHAWNMQVGQVSSPIQNQGHVFVLKLEQKTLENNQSYDDVKESLEKELGTLIRTKLENAIRGP